ncbi:hypothetical protein BU24DRAFT_417870 [Aaosphaeria arxii CBS 175.79]|uniref:non-specific serine/threonine protein kinase n=1 Tax=Aaosphaeria arxii CBS 175.79 TaxID=1450172 RepID=A0A6A5Y9H0_9PLEO|nr:uncharacterized protein BU24DRAFT_417870 [Aaosphaeria arxii CBS 175.79]KAF2022232.1 hypothetical protein BU24DRAFT_417870 [Aaosphaeria arxii CBS 175.79]
MRLYKLGACCRVGLFPRTSLFIQSSRALPSRLLSNTTSHMDQFTHISDVDAEPLHRYNEGGYHPVHLGDVLKEGRYKILHKLGWGSYSTVWAAGDQRLQAYVSIKISVSGQKPHSRELAVLRAVSDVPSDTPGHRYLMTMLDHFQLDGPNGTHDCLVSEVLGQSVADYMDASSFARLPGNIAKAIAKHTLLGLSLLHSHNIGHGDIHTRNIAFTIPQINTIPEEVFLRKLGEPETAPVHRSDGQPLLESHVPKYIVRPTFYPVKVRSSFESIKIIDFGQSFLRHDVPHEFHNPLAVRAPEIIFKDKVDYRMDLWSMGCLLFELLVAQPPFDSIMTTPAILVGQMLDTTGDELPDRWKEQWSAMSAAPLPSEEFSYTLQGWLEELYFDGEGGKDLSREDLVRVGKIIGRLLRLEPSERASAAEILQDDWFAED